MFRGTQHLQWPKTPPVLNAAQREARERYMKLWHEQLPTKYGRVEAFNHGALSHLPLPPGIRTLEIGAGIGGHLPYEDLARQDYYCLEYREEFCKTLREKVSADRVFCGDIQTRQSWPDKHFDRIVAIHVLEHLVDLPAALKEIRRLLTDGGILDVVLPCEGGLAHTLGRKATAERLFKKNFKMDFRPVCQNENVNTFEEILVLLKKAFKMEYQSFFPLKVLPFYEFNFCSAMRWR